MERPNRTAFCKLLFARNGGTFNDRNMPVFDQKAWARGACDRAYDCLDCGVMQDWLVYLQKVGWTIGWECDLCLKQTEEEKDREDMQRFVEGFYQSGRDPTRGQEDPDYDEDKPALAGCTRCGWESSFLQLVLRRKK